LCGGVGFIRVQEVEGATKDSWEKIELDCK